MRKASKFNLAVVPFLAWFLVQASDLHAQNDERKFIVFRYALFFAPESKADPSATTTALLKKPPYAGKVLLRTKNVAPRNGILYVNLRKGTTADYKVPDAKYLEYKGRGLTSDDIEAIQKGEGVFFIEYGVLNPKSYGYLNAVNSLAYAVAKACGGFIWDESTKELFAPAELAKRRAKSSGESAEISNTLTHALELDTGGYRAVTQGLRKLGHADLEIRDFPKGFTESVGELMQFLITSTTAGGPLSSIKTIPAETVSTHFKIEDAPAIALIPGKKSAGDADNTLLTIDFSKFPGDSLGERQQNLLARIFGDEMLKVPLADAEEKPPAEPPKPVKTTRLPIPRVMLMKPRNEKFALRGPEDTKGSATHSFSKTEDGKHYRVVEEIETEEVDGGKRVMAWNSRFDVEPPHLLFSSEATVKAGDEQTTTKVLRFKDGTFWARRGGERIELGKLDYTLADELVEVAFALTSPADGKSVTVKSFSADELEMSTQTYTVGRVGKDANGERTFIIESVTKEGGRVAVHLDSRGNTIEFWMPGFAAVRVTDATGSP